MLGLTDGLQPALGGRCTAGYPKLDGFAAQLTNREYPHQGSPHTLQGRGRHRLLHVQACQAIFLKSPLHQSGKSADPKIR